MHWNSTGRSLSSSSFTPSVGPCTSDHSLSLAGVGLRLRGFLHRRLDLDLWTLDLRKNACTRFVENPSIVGIAQILTRMLIVDHGGLFERLCARGVFLARVVP